VVIFFCLEQLEQHEKSGWVVEKQGPGKKLPGSATLPFEREKCNNESLGQSTVKKIALQYSIKTILVQFIGLALFD
jgi:hypothetical protein